MSQPNEDGTATNVGGRKKRIVQEVLIKIEMSGGYIEEGDDPNGLGGDGAKGGGVGGDDTGDGSQNGSKNGDGTHGEGGEDGSEGGADGEDGGAGGHHGGPGSDGEDGGSGANGEDRTSGEGGGSSDQNGQDGDYQDGWVPGKGKCPEFVPCGEILKHYSYGGPMDDDAKTKEQIEAEKLADKFLSVGPDLQRCSPTTECDPDNNSILKYKTVCPEDDLPVINEEDLVFDENNNVRVNWKKVKRYLRAACPSRKLKLLQALRWRLTNEDPNVQEKSARDIVKHDLFDVKQLCCGKSLIDDLLWPASVSLPHPVQNSAARLFNALVSQETGRDYLKEVSIIQSLTWGRSLRSIVDHSDHTTVDIHTGNMLIGAIMKLSFIPFQRKDMVRKGLLKWLIVHFEDMEQQANSYHLEYSSALLMMLLTVPNSSEFVIDQTRQMLAFFIRILRVPGNTSWPYIRLSMLALFRNPKIASNARQLNLPQILEGFLAQTNDQAEKKSITDVIDQLENPASTSMEDIELQANQLAEDKLYIDEEINKSDPVNCLPDVAGEDLLKSKFACKKSCKKKDVLPKIKSEEIVKKSPCQLRNCMKTNERDSKDLPSSKGVDRPTKDIQRDSKDINRGSKDISRGTKDNGSGQKAYNETTHTFENVPNKNEIFPRTSKQNGSPPVDGGRGASKIQAGTGPPNTGKATSINGNATTVIKPPASAKPAPEKVSPPAGSAKVGSISGGTSPAANKAQAPNARTSNGTGAPSKGIVPPPGMPNKIIQNVEVTQKIVPTTLGDKSSKKILDDVRIGSAQSTKIYSDPTLAITATKIIPTEDIRPGLNFNIRPLRNNEKNRTLKIVCNTDTEKQDNFSCTVFELNDDDNPNAPPVGTATISTTQDADGTINAKVQQNINQ